jgi:hypothetical protein
MTQGGGITKSYGTTVNRATYCVTTAAITGQDTTFSTCATGQRSAITGNDELAATRYIASFPNSFFCGYDLERSAGILFQGLNTRSSPPYLQLFITPVGTVGLTTSVNVNAWGMSDVILQVDTIAKQITAFI